MAHCILGTASRGWMRWTESTTVCACPCFLLVPSWRRVFITSSWSGSLELRAIIHPSTNRAQVRPVLEAPGLLQRGRRRPADVLVRAATHLVPRLPDGAVPLSTPCLALDIAVVNAFGDNHWDETRQAGGSACQAYTAAIASTTAPKPCVRQQVCGICHWCGKHKELHPWDACLSAPSVWSGCSCGRSRLRRCQSSVAGADLCCLVSRHWTGHPPPASFDWGSGPAHCRGWAPLGSLRGHRPVRLHPGWWHRLLVSEWAMTVFSHNLWAVVPWGVKLFPPSLLRVFLFCLADSGRQGFFPSEKVFSCAWAGCAACRSHLVMARCRRHCRQHLQWLPMLRHILQPALPYLFTDDGSCCTRIHNGHADLVGHVVALLDVDHLFFNHRHILLRDLLDSAALQSVSFESRPMWCRWSTQHWSEVSVCNRARRWWSATTWSPKSRHRPSRSWGSPHRIALAFALAFRSRLAFATSFLSASFTTSFAMHCLWSQRHDGVAAAVRRAISFILRRDSM